TDVTRNRSEAAIAPSSGMAQSKGDRVDLEEVADLGLPPLCHERDMVRVLVVRPVRGGVGELHREREAIVVLRAHLAHQLERLDTGDRGEAPDRREQVALPGGTIGVSGRKDDGMADAAVRKRDHAWMVTDRPR